MSSLHTLAFEIGTEEIPAFDLHRATLQLEKLVPEALDAVQVERRNLLGADLERKRMQAAHRPASFPASSSSAGLMPTTCSMYEAHTALAMVRTRRM